MKLTAHWRRFSGTLGPVGLASLGLIAGAIAFHVTVEQPLQVRRQALERQLAPLDQRSAAESPASADSAAGLARFYQFFETGKDAPAQLAQLYAIGKAAGVDLRAAEYRVQKAGPRLVRYEIALPLTAGYAQIRTFLRNALVEIPVLSLDRISIRKERAADGNVQADVRLTLHLVQS